MNLFRLSGFRSAMFVAAALPGFLSAEPLPIKAWTVAQGLAHNQILRIRRDSRGFLWFCTMEGLSRFDGASFTTFDTASGLPHLTVTDVLEARDGSFWVATNGGGVARFDAPDRIAFRQAPRLYRLGEHPAQQRVGALFQDQQGSILAGTDEGVFRLEDGQFRRLDPAGSPLSIAIATGFSEDRFRNLWISSWKGVFRLTPEGRLSRLSVRPLQEYDYVSAVLTDQSGKIWIGAREAGVIVLDPAARWPDAPQLSPKDLSAASFRWFTARDGLPDIEVWSLFESSDGAVWIGSEKHLTTWDGRRMRTIGPGGAISQVAVFALAEDAAGNIWAGGQLGAAQVIRSGFTVWTSADGLSNDIPHTLFEGRDGAFYALTNTPALNRFDGERFQSVPLPVPASLLFHESTLSRLQDREGEWWIPARNGVWRFPRADTPAQLVSSKPRAVYGQRQGLPPEVVVRLFEDSRGDIWFSTAGDRSLARWERRADRITLFDEKDGVPRRDSPLVYGEDRTGAVWMGLMGGGLLRYRGGRFRRFSAADGFPDGAIQSLYLDRGGRLWIGSDTGGAACLEAPAEEPPRIHNIRRFTQEQGLSSNSVLALAEDRHGRIYFGTGRGLDWLDPATGRIIHWHAPTELNINPVSLLLHDRQGYLWVGGFGGLLRFSPEAAHPSPPGVFIAGLRAGDTNLSLPINGAELINGLELTPRQNRLLIQFASAWFVFGERPLYQYKLAGSDADWSAPSALGSVNYANLAPGGYQFLVRPVNLNGQAGEQAAGVGFTVLPPIWRRWWFIGLALMSLGALAFGAGRYRVRQLLHLERVRTRIATDLHDDIGVNLTRISILSEVAKQQAAGSASPVALLDSIAEIARESVSAMSDIVWAINPERDNLLDLTRRMRQLAEEVFTRRDIQLKFSAPEGAQELKLDVNTRRDLYLIFKEAVNNTVRHSGCTRAEIDVRVVGSRICLSVSDDGRGFDPAVLTEGNGLLSMRNRARAMRGDLAIESASGAGSEVRLSVPFSPA